ncbi:hypothetical protein NQZ68_020362 [Dissostichus eleginoides]|nr:hypothetical protein NQZ68_020362 [Dissostichus eleginoides]
MAAPPGRDTLPDHWSYGICQEDGKRASRTKEPATSSSEWLVCIVSMFGAFQEAQGNKLNRTEVNIVLL